MTSRDLVIRTLNHEPVERVPRDLWVSPEVADDRAEELAEIQLRFPRDIVPADFKYPPGKCGKGNPDRAGKYTDAWGCTSHVARRGGAGEVKEPPLAQAAGIAEYQPPFELLEGGRQNQGRLAAVNRQCADTNRFVLAETQTRPFDRLCLLRGRDAALADLQSGAEPTRRLLAMTHDFFCREMEMWAATDVDGVMICDELGSSDGLRIEAALWRSVFRPLYRDYCKILHEKDKFVFLRASGSIGGIFGELIRIGVDAIHCGLFAMDIERLAKRHRGRVTFWGEIDPCRTLPCGTAEEIRDAVRRVRRALDFGSGGVIAQCQWDADVPIQSIVAVFEQWMAPMPIHA